MKSNSTNRSFGLLFFIFFVILGLWPLTNNGVINFFFIIISIPFLVLGLINSKLLTPLNKLWIKLGEKLGIIIAPIIMALVYFVILTPISLIVRIFGKDLIGLKFSQNVNTYWIKRKNKLSSMKKQF